MVNNRIHTLLYGKPTRKPGAVGHPSLPALETLTTFEQALAALDPQQQRFVKHYLAHGVSIAAARHCGIESKNMRLAGSRIRSNKRVAHAIALGRKEVVATIAKDGKTGAEAYVAELDEKIVKAEAEGQFTAVASLLNLKGKALGLLIEKTEHINAAGFTLLINTDYRDDSRVIEHDSATSESTATLERNRNGSSNTNVGSRGHGSVRHRLTTSRQRAAKGVQVQRATGATQCAAYAAVRRA